MNIYRGAKPSGPHDYNVTVVHSDGSTRPLDPRLDIARHAPAGLAWGYSGSGPAQLALAILCDAVGPERARPLYQAFKAREIATLDQTAGWEMRSDDVRAWADRAEQDGELDRSLGAWYEYILTRTPTEPASKDGIASN